MSSISEARPNKQSQPEQLLAIAHDIVDAWYVDQIAELLARRVYKNPTLVLKADVAPAEQKILRNRAALALRCDDPAFDAPALYFAADAMIAVGAAGPLLGSLSRTRRQDKVRLAMAAIHCYRKALAGEAPTAMHVFGQLAVADLQAEAAEIGGQS